MSGSGEDRVWIEKSRLDRLNEVLGMLLAGVFVESLVTIDTTQGDEFAETEELLNRFSRQYIRSTVENDAHLALIRDQRAAILRLSSPLIDVWRDVLVLPIVGAIDAGRAAHMTEQLLRRIEQAGVRCAVVDLTGADAADGSVVAYLGPMLAAARLLGCHCVISGIGPRFAALLAEQDMDLGDVKTVRRLRDGLVECLRHLGRGPGRRE